MKATKLDPKIQNKYQSILKKINYVKDYRKENALLFPWSTTSLRNTTFMSLITLGSSSHIAHVYLLVAATARTWLLFLYISTFRKDQQPWKIFMLRIEERRVVLEKAHRNMGDTILIKFYKVRNETGKILQVAHFENHT